MRNIVRYDFKNALFLPCRSLHSFRQVSPAGRRSKMVTESDDESDSEWETDAQERHGDLAVGKRHADSDAKQRNVFAVTTVVAPHRLLENLCNSPTTKYSRNFLVPLVKYWSIKRQFRRGAPLLKRLHLEVRFFGLKINNS